MKKISLTLLIIITLALAGWLINNQLKSTDTQAEADRDKLQLVTSFYPLYFFTQQIAGDHAQVYNLTAAGIDPHDYEPSPQDLRLIETANLIIGNGAGFETWMDNLDTQVPILHSADDLVSISREEEEDDDHDEEEDEDDHGDLDPHVWLDPILASAQVQHIADTLSELDDQNRDFYQANASALQAELAQLDQEFSQALTSCRLDQVITAHAAFAYLAQRYNFEQVAIQGLSHEEEVTAAHLASVAELAKAQQIKYVFFESLLSPKLAQTLAQEVGASVLLFDPLESLDSEQMRAGADYFSVQRQNLQNLQLALECQNNN
jgi:zinc transport system substrate-binding protein